jgi:tetratricopeptide (TPR) repeat protein/DNA-binding winged helix-turn-helix (wHTH) protein
VIYYLNIMGKPKRLEFKYKPSDNEIVTYRLTKWQEVRDDGGARFLLTCDERATKFDGDQRFKLLDYLINNHGEPLTREELYAAVWGDRIVVDNNLDLTIKYIRDFFHDPHKRLLKRLSEGVYQFLDKGDVTDPDVSPDQGVSGVILSQTAVTIQAIHTELAASGLAAPSTGSIPLKTLDDLPSLKSLPPKRILPLLDVRYRAVPFKGRQHDEEKLWQWLTEGESPSVSFQALVGHAGRGKTRLAIQLLELIEKRSPGTWHAGFMNDLKPLKLEHFEKWNTFRDTLIIIDDASLWTDVLEKVIYAVRDPLPPPGPRLRFLLLDRAAKDRQGWYGTLQAAANTTNRDRLFPNLPLELPTLNQLDERWQVLDATLSMLHNFTGEAKLALNLDATTEGYLKANEMGDPLVLFMAAIVAHEVRAVEPLAWRRVKLAEYFAEREEARIKQLAMHSSPHMTDAGFLPLHMAAYVTVACGLTRAELKDACLEEKTAVQRDSAWSFIDLAKLIEEVCLPPGPNSDALAAVPIVPDIVAEMFVYRIFIDEYQDRAGTISRAFRRKPAAVIRSLVHMVQDFAPITPSIAWDHPSTSTAQMPIYPPASSGGGPAVRSSIVTESQAETDHQRQTVLWLTDMVEMLDPRSFTENDVYMILAALPMRTTAMAHAGRDLLRRLLDHVAVRDWLGARLCQIMGHYEHLLGNDDLSLDYLLAAMEVCKELVRSDPLTFEPMFAETLSAYAVGQLRMGKPTEALEHSNEAVTRFRDLAHRDRRRYLGLLAFSLHNCGCILSQLGRPEEALRSHEEEISYYRDLLKDPDVNELDSDKLMAELVRALMAQSADQADLGRQQEMIASLMDAETLSRELTARNPDSFRPLLAQTLAALGGRQIDCNRLEDALAILRRAVNLWEELASSNPEGFRDGLAHALLNLATVLCHLGNKEAALELDKRALACFEQLAKRNQPSFLNSLLLCRCNVADLYRLMDKGKEGLELVEQSLKDVQDLVRANRAVYLPSLAHVLYVKALLLRYSFKAPELAEALKTTSDGFEAPELPEALKTISQSVALHEELVFHNPGRFLPEAAKCYRMWGTLLFLQGTPSSRSAAADKLAQALRMIKPHAFLFRQHYLQMAKDIAVEYVSIYHNNTGGLPEPRLSAPFYVLVPEAADERYRTYFLRQLISQTFPELLPTIAEHLRASHQETLAEEALQRQSWAPHFSAAAQMTLRAFMWNWQVSKEIATGNPQNIEATLDLIKEIVPQLRMSALDTSTRYDGRSPLLELADALYSQAWLQYRLGRKEEALVSINDAVYRCDLLIRARPDKYEVEIVTILDTCARWLEELGHNADVLATRQKAVKYLEDIHCLQPSEEVSARLAQQLQYLPQLHGPLGQTTEAVEAIEKQVRICRDLVRLNRPVFLARFASALLGQAYVQAMLGNPQQALSGFIEAFPLAFEVARNDPKPFLMRLPELLKQYITIVPTFRSGESDVVEELRKCNRAVLRDTVLSILLCCQLEPTEAEVGTALKLLLQHQWTLLDCVEPTEEILMDVRLEVDALRKLVETGRGRYLGELAWALHGQTVLHYRLGQKEEALASTGEAVQWCDALVQANPVEYHDVVYMVVANRARWQEESGHKEEALSTREKVLQYLDDMSRLHPSEGVSSKLAIHLRQMAEFRWTLGHRLTEVVGLAERAARIWGELAPSGPDSIREEWVRTLVVLGAIQGNLERFPLAFTAFAEALRLALESMRQNAEQWLPNFRGTLSAYTHYLGAWQIEGGAHGQALWCTIEAVERCCEVMRNSPRDAELRPVLNSLLRGQYVVLCHVQPTREVLVAIKKQVSNVQGLTGIGEWLPVLAEWLNQRRKPLVESARFDDALELIDEAFRCYSEFPGEERSKWHFAADELLLSKKLVSFHKDYKDDQRSLPEALETIEQIRSQCNALVREQKTKVLPYLIDALQIRAEINIKLEQKPEALGSIIEAVLHQYELVREGSIKNQALLTELCSLQESLCHEVQPTEAVMKGLDLLVERLQVLVDLDRDRFLGALAFSQYCRICVIGEGGRVESIKEALQNYDEVSLKVAEEGRASVAGVRATLYAFWGSTLIGDKPAEGVTIEAALKFADGLMIITPFALRLPELYGQLASMLRSAYLKASLEGGIEPDPEILAPIAALPPPDGNE